MLLCVVSMDMEAQTSDRDSTDVIAKELMLGEVVIKGSTPHTRMRGNSLETRVVGSDLEHAGTAEDVLGKTPGMYKQGDELKVIGRGAPIYYVNGRRMHDTGELRRISSEQIRSIEVINNPGSEYDASVGAVVRIKLRRMQGEGFSMDAKTTVRQWLIRGGTDPNANLSLNYRHKGWDFFGGTNYNTSRYYSFGNIGGGTFTKPLRHEQKGTLDNDIDTRHLQMNLGINWQINNNHTVGMMVQASRIPYHKEQTIIDEEIWRNDTFEDNIISTSTADLQHQRGLTLNTYYSGQLGKLNIDWNIDIVSNKTRNILNTSEQSLVDDRTFWTDTETRNRMQATKLILSLPIGKSTVKAGAEIYRVVSGNDQKTSSEVIMNSESEVTETTMAAFCEYSLASALGQLTAGFRYEHVSMDYRDNVNSERDNMRKQDNVFPFISWSRMLGNLGLSANYTVKTRRPNYWQLRDATRYHSRYIFESGNAQLKSTINQIVSLMGNYKWLTVGVEYLNAAHKILQWAEPYDDNGAVLLKYHNLDKPVNSVTSYVVAKPRIGFWSPAYTLAITKQFLTLNLPDDFTPSGTRDTSFKRPMYVAYANNAFRFDTPRHNPWLVELNLQYRSKMNQDNNLLMRDILSLEAAIQKSYMNGNLTFRLSMNDILKKMTEEVFVDYGNYNVYQLVDKQTQSITLSVHYRLNATKSKYRGSGAGTEAKGRM